MNKIFFDLDGTLIDSKLRLFRLFQYLVPISKLTYNEYWELKRAKNSHKQILRELFNYDEKQFITFNSNWMELIETEDYLSMDEPFKGMSEYLEELSESFHLYIITDRQFEDRAKKQISQFGWKMLFKDILVTKQIKSKEQLLQSCKTTSQDWIIGDTGKDILTGKNCGLKTIAVLSGFLSKEGLIDYNPDFITDYVVNFNFGKEKDVYSKKH